MCYTDFHRRCAMRILTHTVTEADSGQTVRQLL